MVSAHSHTEQLRQYAIHELMYLTYINSSELILHRYNTSNLKLLTETL